MRTAIVALLALVAIAAAGLWGLAQFGAPKPMVAEEHAPVAKAEASAGGHGAAASDAVAPLAPIQHEPGAAHPNASSDLETEKPKAGAAKADAAKPDASKKVVVAEAPPAPKPATTPTTTPGPAAAPSPPPPPPPPAPVTATTTTAAAPVADAKPTDPLKAAAKKMLEEKLRSVAPPTAATTSSTTLSPGFATTPSAASAPPPAPAATLAPAPAATPAPAPGATPVAPAPDLVQTASAPRPAAAPAARSAAAPAAAVAAAAAAPGSLAEQFKTRKVAYNRPPATLFLDRPIDISLVIDATAAADPAAQLQGFPGEVVKRDVDLSDTVSAQLTGVGFDIVTQTVDRQTLSSKLPNRWQWRVTPTEPGTHTLMLDIFGYKTNSLDAEPLDAYRDQITVQVQQLDSVIKWAKGIQPVFAVIAALAGLLSALIAALRFRRDGKKSS